MLQGQKDLNTVTHRILSELAQVVNAQKGMFYILEQIENTNEQKLKLFAAYAYGEEVKTAREFSFGRRFGRTMCFGKEKNSVIERSKNYIKIGSGLGKASPANLIVLPVLFEKK